MAIERNTFDECCDYICESMEMAAQMLVQRRSASTEIYQPTQGAALSVISRVRLMQASPWFNGNTVYSGWKTSDGKDFISQTYNPDRWGQAAWAAKQVINMGVYSLHTIPKIVRPLSYQIMFQKTLSQMGLEILIRSGLIVNCLMEKPLYRQIMR